MKMRTLPHRAFTLIELLVTITIILVLAGLATAGVQTARKSAEKVREVAAAKTLISAYALASTDRNGTWLPGYDRTVGSLQLPDGSIIEGPAAQRYPYRLAPYFGNRLEGVILVNDNLNKISVTDTYSVSCFPAFGINYLFVGGDFSSNGTQTYPAECVTRPAQAANLLLFASAGGSVSNRNFSGYCILTPPRILTAMWSDQPWNEDARPGAYGQIDARHGGKAICAFLDGSTRMLTIEELRDMRLWNHNAAAQDNPNYSITVTNSSRR